MLKKILFLLALFCWQLDVKAANLVQVYQQALYNDPIFQQAIAQSLVTRDNVPISVADVLPNIFAFINPRVARYGYSGTEYRTGTVGNFTVSDPRNLTQRTYTLDLTVTQPVFNFSIYTNIAMQLADAKSAGAILNAALQNLMIRVSKAYFAVLRDEEEITYTIASKRYYQFQLKQIIDQYQAGVRTLTDVYTARAAYESSVADYIAANKRLANDRENLRAITGIYYPHLSYLQDHFPLTSPRPNNINNWVDIALMRNWSIKAAQYSLEAAKQNIKHQFAGHLPTITLEGSVARHYTFNINGYPSFIDNNGPGTISDRSIGFNVDVPLFKGGGVLAKTDQAKHFYEQQQQFLEENVRATVNNTRQSFTNIIAGISQIKADRYILNASAKSLQGTIDRYNAGIQTLLDVLNREEKLYAAQINYTINRFELINNILLLKEAAGTLSFKDLCIINSWLVNEKYDQINPFQDKLLRQGESTIRQNLSNQKVTANKNSLQKNREIYPKLVNQNQQTHTDIAKLEASLAALQQDLQNKNNQLQIALAQINQLKKLNS